MNIPLIGIPIPHDYHDHSAYHTPVAYCRAIEQAGGIPLLIPLLEGDDHLHRVFALLDGLLLTGGGDVAADCYGAIDSGALRLVDRDRDRVEMVITRWSLDRGLPVLGICRGIQSLNVAAGGTLVQDIPCGIPDAMNHSTDRSLPMDYPAHPITVEPGSLLADYLCLTHHERDAISVNSYHHQSVDQPAPGFTISARSPDGVIEAIERNPAAGHALGVQWHPERMVPGNALMVRLFRSFVVACARPRATV